MYKREYTKIVKGLKKEAVWSLWAEIDSWPKWHGDLDYCRLEGPFEAGSHFWLKPTDMKKPIKIALTEVVPHSHFTDCTSFFGAKMWDTHSVEETSEGLKLTNRLMVKGPLTFLWVYLVAKHVADSVPEETEALIRLAKERHG